MAKRAVYAFAGYVYCVCGEKMYVRSNTPKYVCMKCRTKIPIVDLDRVFQHQLQEFTLTPEAIAAYLAQGAELQAEKEDILSAHLGERERLIKEAEKLYRLYQEDALSIESFRERHQPLEERLQGLAGEIASLQGEIDFFKARTLLEDDIVGGTRQLAERWHEMPIEEQRAVVETFIDRITVEKERVIIDLRTIPLNAEILAKGPYRHCEN